MALVVRVHRMLTVFSCAFFLFLAPATTEIYTLSLHDALPISSPNVPSPSPGSTVRVPLRPPCSGPTTAASGRDRKSTRLNSSHQIISYAVFCLKKKKTNRDALRHGSSPQNAHGHQPSDIPATL